MSQQIVDELRNKIDNDEFHLYFEEDKEDLIVKLECLEQLGEISEEEYDGLLEYVEGLDCCLADCILRDMIECDPDLA